MSGWVKVYRSCLNHELFEENKPRSRFEAWLDLIMLANYKDRNVRLGNQMILVERGSFITSELKLTERWKWSKTKVRDFLLLLESEEMILKKSDRKKTTITIVNYSVYQDSETTEEPQKDQQSTTEKPLKNTTKKVKKDKKEKEKIYYADLVSMEAEEYEKLIAQFGQPGTMRMIQVLDNYKGSSGRKYVSDYRTILGWVQEKVRKENPELFNKASPVPMQRDSFLEKYFPKAGGQ